MSLFYQAFRVGTAKDTFVAADIWEINVDLAGLSVTVGFMDGTNIQALQFEEAGTLIARYTEEVKQKLEEGYVYINSDPNNLDAIIDFNRLNLKKTKKVSYLSLKDLYQLHHQLPADLVAFIESGAPINMHKKAASKLCSSFTVPVHFFTPRLAKHLHNKEVKTVLKDTETDAARLIPFLEAKTTSSYPWDYEAQVYIRLTENGQYEFVILDTDGKYFQVMSSKNIQEFMKTHFEA